MCNNVIIKCRIHDDVSINTQCYYFRLTNLHQHLKIKDTLIVKDTGMLMFSTNSSLNRPECTAAKRNPAIKVLILSALLCLRVYATFMARHLGWICEMGHVKVKNTVHWQYNPLN